MLNSLYRFYWQYLFYCYFYENAVKFGSTGLTSMVLVQVSYSRNSMKLYVNLKVIHWHTREDLVAAMSMAFRERSGTKFLAIIDCFERTIKFKGSSLGLF